MLGISLNWMSLEFNKLTFCLNAKNLTTRYLFYNQLFESQNIAFHFIHVANCPFLTFSHHEEFQWSSLNDQSMYCDEQVIWEDFKSDLTLDTILTSCRHFLSRPCFLLLTHKYFNLKYLTKVFAEECIVRKPLLFEVFFRTYIMILTYRKVKYFIYFIFNYKSTSHLWCIKFFTN